MADNGSAKSKQQGLQQAASMIFALVAVVPLLIFAYTLHALGAIRSTQAQLSLGLAARKADHSIPGVGHIREIAEVARTMDGLWQREAAAHVGKRVSISVANSRDPLIGVISEVSDDGLILDQADGQNAVAYRRVT